MWFKVPFVSKRETPGQAVDRVLVDTKRITAARVSAALGSGTGAIAPRPTSSVMGVTSPWATNELARVVYDDVFGFDVPANTREAAMRFSAVARARNLMCTTIQQFPLIGLRGDTPLDAQPGWMTSTGGVTSPQHRLVWTVDDLMFYGWSCWSRQNSQSDGFPLTANRVPYEDWTVNDDNHVEILGNEVPDDSVVLIPGFHEGILSYGVDVLRDTRVLYRNMRARLTNPVPGLELHQTGGDPLTRPEITQLVDDWAKARAGVNGGVAYTNESITTKELGAGGDQLLIESRNAAALELARLVGVSASRIDATVSKASLNYETTTGRNQELVDFDLALYMAPIVARLSLDDVMPHGQRAAFDVDAFTALDAPSTGPSLED